MSAVLTTMERFAPIALVALALLLGACDPEPVPSLGDLVTVCEDVAACAVAECAGERDALAAQKLAEPVYAYTCEEGCIAECMATGVGCDQVSLAACSSECIDEREAEWDVWDKGVAEALDGLTTCESGCTGVASVGPSSCLEGDPAYDPDACALYVGVDVSHGSGTCEDGLSGLSL